MQPTKYYKKITSNFKALDFDFSELWQYRDLIFLFVKREFVSKYKQTILGPAWAVIQPLLTTVVFTFIFGNVAGLADCGAVPTFLFYMCGNIAWQFFSGCLTGTANTFIGNSAILGKVYFPRLVMPISTVMSNFISFAIQAAMFVIFLVIYLFIPGYEIGINAMALMTPLIIIQMALLGLGCGVIISAATTKYRDLQMLVSFGVQLWMYATPVAYSMNVFAHNKTISAIIRLNPMTPLVEMLRNGWLGPSAGSIDWKFYVIGWVITLVLLFLGVILFNKVEKTFMDTV